MKTKPPEEEEEEEEKTQPPPTQEREVSTPFCMLCYCFLHTVQCGVRVALLHLIFWGGTLLTSTVLLQIAILTYKEWVPEVMGRKARLPLSPPCPSRSSSLRCLCLQGELGGTSGKSHMCLGPPPKHNSGKPAASSLGRGNGLPQSVCLYRRGIHCAEGPSPA